MQMPLRRINQFHSKLTLISNSGGGSSGADSSGGRCVTDSNMEAKKPGESDNMEARRKLHTGFSALN